MTRGLDQHFCNSAESYIDYAVFEVFSEYPTRNKLQYADFRGKDLEAISLFN